MWSSQTLRSGLQSMIQDLHGVKQHQNYSSDATKSFAFLTVSKSALMVQKQKWEDHWSLSMNQGGSTTLC